MIRFLKAGSVPWLLAHEVRLAWRGMDGKSGEKNLKLLTCLFVYHITGFVKDIVRP